MRLGITSTFPNNHTYIRGDAFRNRIIGNTRSKARYSAPIWLTKDQRLASYLKGTARAPVKASDNMDSEAPTISASTSRGT
jgi:hypothetical protein